MPDWRNPQDYDFTRQLNREQWAWEFLRRNPQYQSDYRAFIANWRALEADYGKAPNRDFARWKEDPRAYVTVAADAGGTDCRIREDRVLIECALGAQWGFYKFPLDPATDKAVPGDNLLWRDIEWQAQPLNADDVMGLGQLPEQLALGFDLAMPLKPQLEAAKRYLLATQQWYRRDQGHVMKSVAACRDRWTLCLRLLDAEASGVERPEPGELQPGLDAAAYRALRDEAYRLMAGGYRGMLLYPEG